FTRAVVAAITAVAPDQLPDLAALVEFRRLVPTLGGSALRTDLQNLARLLYCRFHGERLLEIARHRFLAIHMLARLHGRDGGRRMDGVMGGDDHGINVFAFEHFLVIAISLHLGAGDLFLEKSLRGITAFAPDIANPARRHIVLTGMSLDQI